MLIEHCLLKVNKEGGAENELELHSSTAVVLPILL